MAYIKRPQDIEIRSFEIIEEELGEKAKQFSSVHLPIVKRVIHTTADFEYADLLEISEDAVESCLEALKKGGKWFK